MSRRIKVIDNKTGNEAEFPTMAKAAEWVNKRTGNHYTSSSVLKAFKGTKLAKGRFTFEELPVVVVKPAPPKPMDHKKTKDGWKFYQPARPSNIICAERRLNWYNPNKFQRIKDLMKKHKCCCYFDETEDELLALKRKKTTVQIYKRYDDTPFKQKVELFLKLLKHYKILNED